MRLFTGSSDHLAPATALVEVQEKLDLLAIDEPLPEPPARDIVRLLVQSPYRLHLYWNFKTDPFTIARRQFPNRDFRFMVRLLDASSGEITASEIAGFTRNYWFNSLPARTYQAEVGMFSESRPFIRLLVSDYVQTPRVGASPTIAAAKEFAVSTPDFIQMLDRSGFVADAFDVAMEAADETARRVLLEHLLKDLSAGQTMFKDSFMHTGAQTELNRLIEMLAAERTIEEVRAILSSLLARWSAVAIEAETQRLISQAQYVVGSLVSSPTDFNHRWLPSMNGGNDE
ncbi:MAG: DUF4912 domain-containing protein [Pyrinomonadaceae bacterium MAG19_C2-C3]|nr:DUF4912 domain-containing protein [Pyrinomonadaceae bacterium MAG19_C2-C3]